MTYPAMSLSVPWSLVKNGFKKTPCFESLVNQSAGGRGGSGVSMKPYPTWDFEVDLNLVGGGLAAQYSALQSFVGCFMAVNGRAGLFLFTDPNDSSVDDTDLTTPQSAMLNVTSGAATPMGQLGDGTSTQFQLARLIGPGVDILQNVSNVAIIVNGVVRTTGITISASGVVTFAAAPPNNAVLQWAGSFQYLCRFADDQLKDLAMVSKNTSGWLWSCSAIGFSSEFV